MHENLSVRLIVMQERVPCSWHNLTTVIHAVVILRFHNDDTEMFLQEQLSLTMSVLTKLNTFTAIVDLSRSNFSIAGAPLFQLKSAT